MKTISSRQNPEIMSTAALAQAKERNAQHKFIAEGIRTCSTLLANKIKLLQLYVTKALLDQALTITPENTITIVTDPVMEKISQATSPSGIVGVFRIPQEPGAKALQPGLVLANITDPGNMGTLIRTCAALKVESVVIVEGCDPWSPKVVQATAGTLGAVDIFSYSWPMLLKNKRDIPLIALVVSDGQPLTGQHRDALLVVGNEAHGINPTWLATCDEQLTIPMHGKVESLNAAVARSIALYITRSL